MLKKGIIVVTIILLLTLAFKQLFFKENSFCLTNCFVFEDGTWESCKNFCNEPLDKSPRFTKRIFKPYRKQQEIAEEADCPLGYAPKILPKQKKNANTNTKKPNIVFIILDDQDEITSPYLDEMPFVKQLLYDNGTSFTHAFAPTPICCAARCQLLTGLYGHNNGVLTNSGKFGGYKAFMKPFNQNNTRMKDEQGRCINNEDRFLPSMLQANGYETQAIGKYINQFEFLDKNYIPDGWSDFRVGANHELYTGQNYDLIEWNKGDAEAKIVHYGLNEEDYSTDVIRDKAIEFVRRTFKEDKEHTNKQKSFTPKFMYVAVTAPHFPLQPAKRHMEKKKHWAEQFQRIVTNRTNYAEQDISDKSSWLQDRYRGVSEWIRTKFSSRIQDFNQHKWHQMEFPKRMASLSAVDELVQSIYQEIEKQGEIDNTVFILTSDNGYNLGAHRLVHKMAPYEESIRIPLAISGPGIKKRHIINDFVKLQDMAPTILDLAGIEIPEYMDGISLMSSISELEHNNNSSSSSKGYGDADILLQYAAHGAGELMTETIQGILQEIPTEWITKFPYELLQDIPPFIGIRTKEYAMFKFSYYGNENQIELYDMKNDSYQMENICRIDEKGKQSETCIKLLSKLEPQLQKLRICSGKNCNRKD